MPELQALRWAVFQKDGGYCHYCGLKLRPQLYEWDHVIPASRAGPTTYENLVPACVLCNRLKHMRTGEQFQEQFGPFLRLLRLVIRLSRLAGVPV